MVAFADATGRGVDVPPSVYELDRPLRLPRSGVFRGPGAGVAEFRPAPGVYLGCLLLAAHPQREFAPPPSGLSGATDGWLNLRDVWQPPPTDPQLYFDIAFTLDATDPAEYSLADATGSIDDVTRDTPFRLSLVGSDLHVTVGGVRRTFSGVVGVGPNRVVVQRTAAELYVWHANGSGTTLLASDVAPPLVWPIHCDLTIGRNPVRFPEGAAIGNLHPAATVHGFACFHATVYIPAVPPSGYTIPPTGMVLWCDFSESDGCLVKARYADADTWLVFRNGTESFGGYKFRSGGFSFNGMGRIGAGFCAAAANDFHLYDVDATGCRHAVLMQSQNYGGRIDRLHAHDNHVGLSLSNNTGIVTVADCHLGEGNSFGMIAADSDALTIVNGWCANNTVANLVVKGDQCSLVCVGGAFGFEGGSGESNIRLHNLSALVMSGTALTPLFSSIPAVEMSRCSGGHLNQVRFGLHLDCEGAILTINHDATRPVLVDEARRWGPGAAPIFDPAST